MIIWNKIEKKTSFFLTCDQHLTLEGRLWYHAQFLSAFLHRFHILPFNFALIRCFTCSLSSYYLHFWSLHDKCPVSLAYYHSIHSRSLFHLLIVAKLATTVLEFVPHPHMVYRFRLSYCFCYNHAFLNELDRSTDKKKLKTTTKNTIINWTGQLTGILSTNKRRIYCRSRTQPAQTNNCRFQSKTVENVRISLRIQKDWAIDHLVEAMCDKYHSFFFFLFIFANIVYTILLSHKLRQSLEHIHTRRIPHLTCHAHPDSSTGILQCVCDVCGARWCANN